MEPTAEADAAEVVERRRRRGRRIVIGSFLSVATLFILSSAFQITRGVFGGGPEEVPAASGAGLSPSCRDGLFRLHTALDRAFPRASAALVAAPAPDGSGEEAVTRAFADALLPEWADEQRVRSACTEGGGTAAEEALAAVLRLKKAEETSLRRQAAELAPLRRRVAAYITR